ncbi:ATP-binding protein [Methanospirillum lacunae]|uniref:Hybrid sensor histidine kinase/response regulator n=1 Tax=Methanospirillum lacunae TaxID=668570 RepID=A0A2V2N455_9EURY|nr:ATP-binding protein [Methanospirillum lacunae]PWR70251.1 hybrid sensor histidine kinase/response regulator [Methanospirillum lacunae]
MKKFRLIPWKWNRFLVSFILTTLAASLRIWPLQILESRLVWLTFYPAVMISAIYGGFSAGLMASVMACILAFFFWPFIVTQPFIYDSADLLGLVVFLVTGVMISGVAEAMRRANIRAKEAQKEAESANNAKSVFLANMSHELRTPLNAVLGFSNLMRNDINTSPDQRITLDIISRSGEHLLNLINDILDMSKIEAGGIVTDISPFDLGGMVNDVLDLMHVRADEKKIILSLDQTSDFPRFIRGDYTKIRQILINLIGNAIKFTLKGKVTLFLNAKPSDDSKNRVIIFKIQDTGIGISHDDQKRIFEPFIQVNNLTYQKGTGLGLTITKQYVELMNGTIQVESSPGEGSIFSVEIPVEIANESDIDSTNINHGRVIGMEPGQDECRILIVEDQIENWLLLRRILEDVGLSIQVAGNGKEAIELFSKWHPHLIFMDLRMPVMDGIEAAQNIRAMEGGKDVKIVAITASVFKEERDNVMAAGMDDFIRKPYRPEEVFTCITSLLGVQFIVEESSTPDKKETYHHLNPSDIQTLPDNIKAELLVAIENLDAYQIKDVITRISEINPDLGSVLKNHADRFSYTVIFRALNSSDQHAQDEKS